MGRRGSPSVLHTPLPFLYIGRRDDLSGRLNRPILVVSDVAARLVRRGLLDPTDPTLPRWRETRVLVFAQGPVVLELPRVVHEAVADTRSSAR